jgi:hypothetical protein
MPKERAQANDALLSEAEVRQVLQRAARLEAGGSLSVAELTRVAQEAGFSPETVAIAIRDVLEALDLSQAPSQAASAPIEHGATSKRLRKLASWPRLLLSALVGGSIGFFSRFTSTQPYGDDSALFAVLVLVVATLFRAVHHRRDGDHEAFQLEVAGIWAGFTAGWSLAHGAVWGDLLFTTSLIWLVSAILGALIILFRLRRAEPTQPPSNGVSTKPT